MTTVIVQHEVADFGAWKPVFDEHGATRDAHGCTSTAVFRAAGDPNAVTIVMEYPSLDAAQAFASDPSLKEAMGRAGVTSAPQISFLEKAEASV